MINVYTTPTNQQQSDIVQHASTLLSLHNTVREPSTGRVGVLAGAAAAKASHPSKGMRDYPVYCGLTGGKMLLHQQLHVLLQEQQLQALLQELLSQVLISVSPTATVSGKAMDTIMLACVADMCERPPYSCSGVTVWCDWFHDRPCRELDGLPDPVGKQYDSFAVEIGRNMTKS